MVSSSPSDLFCPIRRKWVRATPEEHIRHTLLTKMVHEWGYPHSLIAVECSLESIAKNNPINIPKRRIDVVVFTEGALTPLLLIECKRAAFSKKALYQLLGYNYYLNAPFVGISDKNLTLHIYSSKTATLLSNPSYSTLLA